MNAIIEERKRQVAREGYDHAHDDEHVGGEIGLAAQCYFDHISRSSPPDHVPENWPWERGSWKPAAPERTLVKAGALFLAEAERIERAGGNGAEIRQMVLTAAASIDALESDEPGLPR